MTPHSRSFFVFYGGTFDPVHEGHLAVADAAAAVFDSDIILIPAGDPPHRPPPGATAEQRAHMLDLAVRDHPRLCVDRRELQGAGPSYSVNTLTDVRAVVGSEASVAWLLGADAFAGLPSWYRWRDMFNLAHLVVARRPGFERLAAGSELEAEVESRWTSDPQAIRNSAHGLVMELDLPLRHESATGFRQLVAGGQNRADGIPLTVAAYIRDHRLYVNPGRRS